MVCLIYYDDFMIRKSSLRIDTPIQTFSAIRTGWYVGLTMIFVLLAWRAELSLLYYVLILIVSAGVTGYLALAYPIVLHLSQPPIDEQVDKNWQIMLRTSRGDALWQAHLLKTYRYSLYIHFEFMIVEPYQRPIAVTIFRDQVSAESWRELNALANVVLIKAS